MKNIIKVFTVVGLTLIITFTLASCKTPEEKQTEKAKAELEGTWVNVETSSFGGSSSTQTTTYTFNNGNFELQHTYSSDPTSTYKMKGTFTVSGSLLTMTPTHEWGPISGSLTEEKWYTIAEIKQAYKDYMGGSWNADAEKNFNEGYGPQVTSFSVNGSTLYIGSTKFTKK